MYSDNLLRLLETKELVYKAIWLMLPLIILVLSFTAWLILEFVLDDGILANQNLLNLLTLIFCAITLVFVIVGTRIKKPVFDFKLENFDFEDEQKLDSISANDRLESLNETELMIYKTSNSIISRVILLCGFLEVPVIFGLVLSFLSGSLVYCLGGSLVGLFLWKKYIPSPAAFRREFFERVDSQLKNLQNLEE